jgi:hypothetical protein
MRTTFASRVAGFGIAVVVSACGGSSLDPGAGNDPGTGTSTLAIDGSVRASPRVINAHLATDFDTDFSLRVSLNNQTVTVGTVTVTSATGKVPLTHRNTTWTGTAPSYEQVYVLDVVSGADKVEGVRVDGPDIHVLTRPTEGATVDSTMPLAIEWTHADRADSAELRTEAIEGIAVPDTGAYSLAAGSLQADKSQARQQVLRLSRTNRVVPSGSVAGSSWSATIENRIDVVARPQPPL